MEAFDQPDAADELRPPRVEHARPAGAGTAQRRRSRTTWPSRSPTASAARPGPTRGARSNCAYRLAAGRPPTRARSELAVAFLQTQPLREFALAVFNLNAFLYVN